MKWFLIYLAISLVGSEKLDGTYLPPPGAHFSGGNLGDRDVPLQPPDHSHPINTGHEGFQTNFGLSGELVDFGDRIPKIPDNHYRKSKVPITTTSYAFSQTTTYPPAENYESTALPINPVTGLPVNLSYSAPEGQTLPNYTQDQGQNAYGTNFQPNFGSTTAPATYASSSYGPSENQPLNQYSGPNVLVPGSEQFPGSDYTTTRVPIRYPSEHDNKGQQEFPATGTPNSKGLEDYPRQNVVRPESAVLVSGGDLNSIQYADEQLAGQQGFIPSIISPTSIQPDGSQYGVNNSPRNSNIVVPQPGQTSYSIPSSYYNNVSGTTLAPVPSSTAAYSSIRPIYRPERPQSAADRNAVILNYENVRTPNSYSYSFDTSNGIHADESGVVDNGSKVQGAYSYIGDDGKIYSLIYTADENGFQPRGDHLPTPPPIPEAIQRVIEQAARDKEAGIIDDGSYDEAKYGEKKYNRPANRRHPQILNSNQVDKKPFNGDRIKPIAGINDSEYDEVIPQDQYINNLPVTETRQQDSYKNIHSRFPYQVNGVSSDKSISEVNKTPSRHNALINQNGMPITNEGMYEINNYEGMNPEFSDKLPYAKDVNQNNQFGVGNRKPAGRRPIAGGNNMKTTYSDSQTDVNGRDYPESERGEDHDGERQSIKSGSPSVTDGLGEFINTKFDSATGVPMISNQSVKQIITGNIRPSNEQATPHNDSGYYYQPPNTKVDQNNFPTRFNTREKSTDSPPDQRRTEFNKSTTRRPFITPNVYSQNDGTRPSTTRRPFTTKGVTSPTYSSYTDYDDDDYGSDQEIDDKSSNNPNEKSVSTYQPTFTTLKPQYTPDIQRTRVTQKDSVNPRDRTENSETLTPRYRYGSTSPMPPQSSRFGTEEPQTTIRPQNSPSTTINRSSATVTRPVSSEIPSSVSNYKYQTTRPVSEYYGTTAVPGYPTTNKTPGFGLVSSTPGLPVPKSYTTSTNRPSQDYSSVTPVLSTSDYRYSTQTPSSTPGVYQTSESYHTGYHYGRPKSDYSLNILPNPGRPDFNTFTPSGIPVISPIYQTYQQGPDSILSTTSVPTTGRIDQFIQSQRGNFPNGPSTPNYSTTVLTSTTEGKPESSRSPILKDTNRYEYGPSYTTTDSPSTIRTTPGSFISPAVSTQDYSTTYRPDFQTIKNTFISSPVVDGFGRPITVEQGGSHPGFYQGENEEMDNEGPKGVGTEQSTAYPYDQSKVIGEDFSGPNQPQRYDTETGYYYK